LARRNADGGGSSAAAKGPPGRKLRKIMGVKTASELAEIIVSVGLAQNLAALRALATEGIQRGHMSLHARQVAIAAGASGDMIEKVASQMVAEKVVRIDRAEEILKELQKIQLHEGTKETKRTTFSPSKLYR
jgi:hydroxymethylglutaryl-CoA reductase